MSTQRIDDVRSLLYDLGWIVDEEQSGELYHVSNGSITWDCTHEFLSTKMTVEFQLFHDLGLRTTDLKDVTHCSISDLEDTTLYFSKRNSEEWKNDLNEFAKKLAEWTDSIG